jgi:hypothetical protein
MRNKKLKKLENILEYYSDTIQVYHSMLERGGFYDNQFKEKKSQDTIEIYRKYRFLVEKFNETAKKYKKVLTKK